MSQSRGRQPVTGASSGESPEVLAAARSASRSRDRAANHGMGAPISSGRGGAGNVRSPSRDPGTRERAKILEEEENRIAMEYDAKHKDDVVSAGRGGAGNIGVAHHADHIPESVKLDQEL